MEGSKLLLVIDEDDEDREFLSEIISSTSVGVEVITEKSCQAAISKLRSKVYSVPRAVFLGITSPTNRGLACLASLRSELPNSLSIYVASSSLTQPLTVEIMNAGATGVLNKSGDLRLLKAQLERAVQIS